MAPVLCITTTGDRHHEDALQGSFGDRYVSAFLLLSYHCDEFDVRSRLGVANFLRRRAPEAYAVNREIGLSASDHNPRYPIRTICAVAFTAWSGKLRLGSRMTMPT